MGDGMKVVLGGVVGALVALLLAGGLFGGGMGRMMGGSVVGGAVLRAVLDLAPSVSGRGGGLVLQQDPAQVDIWTKRGGAR